MLKKGNIILNSSKKVIGWFSHTNKGTVFCDGDSCIIAGSKELMEGYIRGMNCTQNDEIPDVIKKTRFEEIQKGLEHGAAYSFDQESYSRFLPIIRKRGGDFSEPDFVEEDSSGGGISLIRVEWKMS